MKFKIQAKNSENKIYEREIEAPDRFAMYKLLKKEGDTAVLSVQELMKTELFGANFLSSFLGKVGGHEKIMFAHNFGTMLKAGLPLSRALSILEKQTKNKKFKSIVGHINSEIAKGSSLHVALEAYPDVFNGLFVSMVRVGEESGRLSDSLISVGQQMDRIYGIQKKVRSAMIYPAIILSVMAIVGMLLLTFVVPSLVQTFKDLHADLPFSTEVIIFLSDFITQHYFVVLLIFVSIFFILRALYKSKGGRNAFDFMILRSPLIAELMRELNMARITRTLAAMLSSGVDTVLAFDIASQVTQNNHYRKSLSEAGEYIQKGESLSSVFSSYEKLYSPFFVEMVTVGEETGELASMLGETASFYEGEVDQKTKDMSTIIEPVLMVIIGATVGFFAVSMITPMYSVLNTL
ncbi:MAG: type II secretion system F family protein [Patescibacteria group bacterium]